MRPTKDVQKFWKALVAAGGSMTRVILRRNVFGSNRSAAELDAFLRCPLLSDLVTETRERDCKTGRPARRYILTAAGWEAARLWQLPTSDNLGLEELRRQFDRLVLAGCPWACDLVRYAELGKQREAKFQAIKEQVRALAAEKLEEWKAAHPIVKHPSKGRNRSPEEMRQRAAWARAHFRKSDTLKPSDSVSPAFPVAPAGPVPTPSAFDTKSGALPASGWAPPTRPTWRADMYAPAPSPFSAPAPASDKQTAGLLTRIKAAGYRTNDHGEVLFDNKWIPASEWVKRMPDALS